jgi:hypothetical protein
MNKINEALNKRFEEYRIIFWYDGRQELLSLVVGGGWLVVGVSNIANNLYFWQKLKQ